MLPTAVDGTTANYVSVIVGLVQLDGLVRTWYAGDALGSVRQTLDDAGELIQAVRNAEGEKRSKCSTA